MKMINAQKKVKVLQVPLVLSALFFVLTGCCCNDCEANPCCPPPRCYECRPQLAPQPHWGGPCPGDPSYYTY